MGRTAIALSALFVGYVAAGYRSSVASAGPTYIPTRDTATTYLTNSEDGSSVYVWSLTEGKVSGVTRYTAASERVVRPAGDEETRSLRVTEYAPVTKPR